MPMLGQCRRALLSCRIMPTDDFSFADISRRILKLFKSGEVKTPLSFVFRALGIFAIVVGVVIYAPVKDDLKWNIIVLAFGALPFFVYL